MPTRGPLCSRIRRRGGWDVPRRPDCRVLGGGGGEDWLVARSRRRFTDAELRTGVRTPRGSRLLLRPENEGAAGGQYGASLRLSVPGTTRASLHIEWNNADDADSADCAEEHLLLFCGICGILRHLRSTGFLVVKARLSAAVPN